jgi:hypothetical protein
MLIACPLVFFVTDRMDARVEVFRDCFFLATFTTVSLTSGAWLGSLLRAGRWGFGAFAATCAAASSVGACVLIALVLYLE